MSADAPARRAKRPPAEGWADLPVGCFTGIDWSRPQAMDHSDPYLAWAETSGFAGFRSPQGPSADPRWLPLLLELKDGVTVQDLVLHSHRSWLQIPRVYQHLPTGLRFCTARARRGFFEAMKPGGALHERVQAYELGLPVGHHSEGLAEEGCATPGDVRSPLDRSSLARGPVMVVIDDGLAVGHGDFLRGRNKTRVVSYWRQDATVGPHGRAAATPRPVPLDPARAGPTPMDMGYGHEMDRRWIQSAIDRHTNGRTLDEDGLYQHLQMWSMQHNAQHGTHVSSLAAGPWIYTQTIGTESSPPQWTPSGDPASQAALVVVQLDSASVADSSGGAMNVSVLDALAFALSRCASDAQVVINLSWGALAGPHNGTSLLERAMAQIVAQTHPGAPLILPAGNAYQARTHANARLRPGEKARLHWRIQPDDHSQSFLELWFGIEGGENGQTRATDVSLHQKIEIVLTPPGATAPLPPMKLGQSGVWPSAEGPICGLLFPSQSALGQGGPCAVLALAPTATWFENTTLAPAGVWRVEVHNGSQQAVIVDAYVERDDVPLGVANTGARQSYLEDRHYDTEGGINGFIDQPDNPSLVRRSGTFNDLATRDSTISVGGIRYFGSATDPMARYSPRLPDPDAARPERAGVRKVPQRLAVSDDHATLWGVRAAGTRSAATVRLVGTSMAAPQVARLNMDDTQRRPAVSSRRKRT